MMKRTIIFTLVAAVLIIAAVSAYFLFAERQYEFHEHVNFAVYLDGERYNFSQERYMFEDQEEREFVHMHDMNGGVMHVEKEGTTLGMFFESLGMKLDSCFTLDNGTSYCPISVYVNGRLSDTFDVPIHDMDRILVTTGGDTTVQLSSVPDDACIYSEKCPAPPGFIDTESLSCAAGKEDSCSL